MNKVIAYIGIFLSLLTIYSCGEDRTYEYEEKTQHNQWMLEVMLDQYLWADTLASYEPTWKSFFAKPSEFLSTLTSKTGQSDSWSYVEVDTIASDSHERGYFNHINTYGYDFKLMTDPTGQTTKSVLRVLTVYPGSPAEQAGLKRNDYICSYDSYKITSNNVSKLQKGVARSLEVRHLEVDDEGVFYWSDTTTLSMSASTYVEDDAFPVSSILDVEGVRVGYLMCTRLLAYPEEKGTGRTSDTTYRDKLDQIMQKMKQSGVTEFVLDLRLCNYGTLDMAQRLASYVVAPQYLGETFVKTYRNENHTSENITLSYDTSLGNLGLSRLYIITGSYTQGAPEWLIHSLQHTMGAENVYLLGEATQGQNVMTEEVGYQYYVHLYPVVAYVADGNGDYDYGSITPTETLKELEYLYLGGYGTVNEILLYTAIQRILGIGQDVSENEGESDNSAEEESVE